MKRFDWIPNRVLVLAPMLALAVLTAGCSSAGGYPDELAGWIAETCDTRAGASAGKDAGAVCECYLEGFEERIPSDEWVTDSEGGYKLRTTEYDPVLEEVIDGCRGPEDSLRAQGLEVSEWCGEGFGSDSDVVVIIQVGVDDETVEAIRADIDELSEVSAYEYVDQEAALREYEELSRQASSTIPDAEAHELPASFRLQVGGSETTYAEAETVAQMMSGVGGVREARPNITLPGSPVC